jgi:hypothetical protein
MVSRISTLSLIGAENSCGDAEAQFAQARAKQLFSL